MHSMVHLGRLWVKSKQCKLNITDLVINKKCHHVINFVLTTECNQWCVKCTDFQPLERMSGIDSRVTEILFHSF